MIVEFAGSPASGKTSIANKLYDKGYYPFRLSSKSRWQRVLTLTTFLSFRFLKNFISGFFVLQKNLPDLKLRRLLILSSQGAMSYTLRMRKDVYIKDQGFFQFGDWIKMGMEKDVDYLALTISSIKAQPDIVVFFNLSPKLIISRMKDRGDYRIWLERALDRGYNNVVSRLKSQNQMLDIKYALCNKLNVPYITFVIDDKANILYVLCSPSCEKSTFDSQQINNLKKDIVNCWSCNK